MRQRPVTETSSRHRARAANHRGFSSFIGGYLGLGVTTPAAAGTAAVATVAVVAAAGACKLPQWRTSRTNSTR